jgi:cobalt/nickel transport system permease protein
MTMVLLMQAFFFADGGLLAFGANAFNMAIIGSLTFYIVKVLTRKNSGITRFASSVFIASWVAAILTALATGLELGFSTWFAGGVMLTLPSMVSAYALEGLIEAVITTTLVTSLLRLQPTLMMGLKLLRGNERI